MKIFIICIMYLVISIIINYLTDKYYHTFIFSVFICDLSLFMVFGLFKISSLVICFLLLYFLYKLLCYIFSNKEVIIKDGKLNFNLKNNNYTFDRFLKDLEKNNISKIDRVSSSYIKNNKMYVSNKPNIFIKDGIINYETLDLIGKDSLWLTYNINKNNIRLSDIKIAFYINGTSYFVKNS